MTNRHKRLKRNRKGSFVLPSGETITKAEDKMFKALVAKANRVRDKWINKIPDEIRRENYLFGKQTDYLYSKKSSKVNVFTNKKEFRARIRSLKKYTSKGYMEYVVNTYRDNYIQALKSAFSIKRDDPIIQALKALDWEDLFDLIAREDLEDISYVYYDPEESKLQRIRHQLGVGVEPEKLGMKEKPKEDIKSVRRKLYEGSYR